jgi:hypothetical protein
VIQAIAVALWMFMFGCIVGIQLAERKHKDAIDCHDSLKSAARKALDAQTFVGRGMSVSNISIWKFGKRRVQVTIQPAENFAEHL